MAKRTLHKKIEDDIKVAFGYHKVDNWDENSKRYVSFIEGKYAKYGKDSKYVISTFYNLLNMIIPSLYYNNPFIKCIPTKRHARVTIDGESYTIDCDRASVVLQQLLNNALKNMDFAEEIRQVVQDALVTGIGILKVGYQAKSESERDVDYIYETKEECFSQRISPYDYGFDPMSTKPDSARYEIHRIVKTVEELQEHPQYGKKCKDLEGQPLEDGSPSKKRMEDAEYKDARKYVTLYEYHDHEEDKIYTYIKDGRKHRVLWERDNPFRFGCHFIVLKFTGDTDKFRGISMLGMVEDQALALNTIFTHMVRHQIMFAGLMVYEYGSIDEDELYRWENSEQGDILQVHSGALQQGRVKRLNPLQMGSEYFSSLTAFNQIIDRTLGIPDFQRPGGTKRKTATESSFEQSGANLRTDYFLGFVQNFVKKSVAKIASIIQQLYDGDDWIKIGGEFGDWVKWKNAQIQGQYAIDFEIDTMLHFSQSQGQGLLNALNTMGTNQTFMKVIQDEIDPKKFVNKVFKAFGTSLASVGKDRPIFRKERDPYEENEIARAGKRIPDAQPNEDHDSHNTIHEPEIKELMAEGKEKEAEELMRHSQMHEYLRSISLQQGLQQPNAQGQQPQQGQPQGQQGPTAQPQPAMSQPESVGNIPPEG